METFTQIRLRRRLQPFILEFILPDDLPLLFLYFLFHVSPENRMDDYLSALEKELDYTAVKFAHKKLNSIYIGGGTPTTLNPKQLDRLIRKIKM